MSQPDRIEFTPNWSPLWRLPSDWLSGALNWAGCRRPIARFTSTSFPAPNPPLPKRPPTTICSRRASPSISARELSRLAGLALDVEDPFATNWTLEISSPGLQRPFFKIDQLRNYVGRELEVVLAAPLDTWPGRKKFSGVLAAVADEEFTLSLPDTSRKAEEPEEVTIAWPFVRKATLVHHFPEPGKKLGGKKDSKDSKGTRGGAA